MRQYEPIWLKIKATYTASLSAPPALHARIIQAVRKEKAIDLAWRYMLAESKERYELKEEVIGKIITFTLVSMEYKPNPGLRDL